MSIARRFPPNTLRTLGLAGGALLAASGCMPDADGLSAGLQSCGSSNACAGAGSRDLGGASGAPSSAGGEAGRSGSAGGSGGDLASAAGASSGGAEGGSAGDVALGGAGGTSDGVAGSTDIGGGGSAEPPCGGCVHASIPVTMVNTAQVLTLTFSTPVDLAGATLTVRLRAPGARGGMLQIFAQDVSYGGDYSFLRPLTGFPIMADVEYVIPRSTASYNSTQIRNLSVAVWAGNVGSCVDAASCYWAQPTILDIDSITLTRGTDTMPDPFTFESSVDPETLSTYKPIEGSTLTWIP